MPSPGVGGGADLGGTSESRRPGPQIHPTFFDARQESINDRLTASAARPRVQMLHHFRGEGHMGRITRRRFIQYGLGVGGALALPWPARAAAGGKLAKYVQP